MTPAAFKAMEAECNNILNRMILFTSTQRNGSELKPHFERPDLISQVRVNCKVFFKSHNFIRDLVDFLDPLIRGF